MTYKIYPYKLGSQSARRLADGLDAIRVRPDGRYRFRESHRIINWGNSILPNWMNGGARERIVNQPEAVGNASNKIRCFQVLRDAGVQTVPFTTDRDEARGWEGLVFARMIIQGHSGAGIEVVNESQDLPVAPLYTHGIPNYGEYRVHVMNGDVIGYTKKSRRMDNTPSEAQNRVRTLANGWVYRSGSLRRLDRIESLAIDSVEALGLDFGAVDIIMDGQGEVYVLEVNTAVGLSDRTLDEYLTAFNQHYNA